MCTSTLFLHQVLIIDHLKETWSLDSKSCDNGDIKVREFEVKAVCQHQIINMRYIDIKINSV